MFWKHLIVLPIAPLLREVKQSQIDRLTSSHACQNMSPILKILEAPGNNLFPGIGGWETLEGVGIPNISTFFDQEKL